MSIQPLQPIGRPDSSIPVDPVPRVRLLTPEEREEARREREEERRKAGAASS